MRKFLSAIFLAVLLLTTPLFIAGKVVATSAAAYQDYLYQFDLYRQKYADFQVAKNEYQKFKSLTAQQQLLDNTKAMLAQRDQLLRAYLLFLNEKLNEDQGLSPTSKQLYQTLIANEVKFLNENAALVPSISSLDDAITISGKLESHYQVLQTTIRQIITAVALGKLMVLSRQFDTNAQTAQTLVNTNTSVFSAEKIATMNRWLLQITNKKTLYQQKIDEINSLNTSLTTADASELDRKFSDITKKVGEARQYLLEGTSYLGELGTELKYSD